MMGASDNIMPVAGSGVRSESHISPTLLHHQGISTLLAELSWGKLTRSIHFLRGVVPHDGISRDHNLEHEFLSAEVFTAIAN
jgi:hypothetical protein